MHIEWSSCRSPLGVIISHVAGGDLPGTTSSGMLAYSSVAQIGYMLLGMSMASVTG
jgi:NADH:ubiquinone oxidoreductase subunit 4 (subunit M)